MCSWTPRKHLVQNCRRIFCDTEHCHLSDPTELSSPLCLVLDVTSTGDGNLDVTAFLTSLFSWNSKVALSQSAHALPRTSDACRSCGLAWGRLEGGIGNWIPKGKQLC